MGTDQPSATGQAPTLRLAGALRGLAYAVAVIDLLAPLALARERRREERVR